jgi:hypothetical protein
MSESANLNPDMTSISWVQEDKTPENKDNNLEDKNLQEEPLEDKKVIELEEETKNGDGGGDGLPEPALSTREI